MILLHITDDQVLEYDHEASNQWSVVGNLEVARSDHAALSIGPKQLPCLYSGGIFNRSQI